MKLSMKCQYALKALFELAWRNTGRPVKTHSIAAAQGISPRFAEIILNDLKHGGFVDSRRGKEGGYILARDTGDLTVRDVIDYIQGPISLVPDATKANGEQPFWGNEAFKELWQEVNNAVSEVCGNKTFAELVEYERAKRDKSAVNYSI
ncbi:MAG: RrF2 family transcriptional regulator [Planctomycetota bacterium]|jgi:Rrf2 family protein